MSGSTIRLNDYKSDNSKLQIIDGTENSKICFLHALNDDEVRERRVSKMPSLENTLKNRSYEIA